MGKIGLKDTTNSIFSLISSILPDTSDRNTGFVGVSNDDAASSLLTFTMTNMDSSSGIKYNSGDPYIQFDSVNDELTANRVLSEINSATNFTQIINLNLTNYTDLQWLFWNGLDNDNRYGVLITSNQIRLIFNTNGEARYNVTGVAGVDSELVIKYDGGGSTNSDRVKLFIGDNEITADTFEGTGVPTSLNDMTGGSCHIALSGSPIGGKLYNVEFYTDTKDSNFTTERYQIGRKYDNSIRGIDNGDGTLTLKGLRNYNTLYRRRRIF